LPELDELKKRLTSLEKRNEEEMLILVEFLSNISFFGQLKKEKCENAKNNQCAYFLVPKEEKNKLPIIVECAINDCKSSLHYHLETSNITCCLCYK